MAMSGSPSAAPRPRISPAPAPRPCSRTRPTRAAAPDAPARKSRVMPAPSRAGSTCSMRARYGSYFAGSFSASPRCAASSSTAKPGGSVWRFRTAHRPAHGNRSRLKYCRSITGVVGWPAAASRSCQSRCTSVRFRHERRHGGSFQPPAARSRARPSASGRSPRPGHRRGLAAAKPLYPARGSSVARPRYSRKTSVRSRAVGGQWSRSHSVTEWNPSSVSPLSRSVSISSTGRTVGGRGQHEDARHRSAPPARRSRSPALRGSPSSRRSRPAARHRHRPAPCRGPRGGGPCVGEGEEGQDRGGPGLPAASRRNTR